MGSSHPADKGELFPKITKREQVKAQRISAVDGMQRLK